MKIKLVTLAYVVLFCVSQINAATTKRIYAPRYDATRLHTDKTHNEHLKYRRRNRYRFLPYQRYWPWHRSWKQEWKSDHTSTEILQAKSSVPTPARTLFDKASVIEDDGEVFAERIEHKVYRTGQDRPLSFLLLALFFIFSMIGLAFVITKRQTL